MKTLNYFFTALFALSVSISCAQDKDPAQFKRITTNYEINEFKEYTGEFDIVINSDSENKTSVKGKLKDYDYLNFNNKTFSTTEAIVQHYSVMIIKAGGSLVSKSESIHCSNEAGYSSNVGNGAVFKLKQNDKDTWLLVLAINEGNYKLLMIE